MKTGLPAVIDAGVEIMIFGSFPGELSLQKNQYYAHPQNQFWRLLSVVIDCPLVNMEYTQRLAALLAHRIGLWDVIACCERIGSLDSRIRNTRHNDFSLLMQAAPQLRRFCFNGKTAAGCALLFADQGFETIVLPSSSPAYTLSFEKKLEAWRAMVVSK